MKIFSKLTALALVIATALGCLASCDKPTVKPTEPDTSYVANVKITYATNDDKMNDAVAGISSTSVVSVDGDRADVVTESVSDQTTVSERYIFDGGKLYHTTKLAVGEFELCENEVASVDEIDITVMLTDFGVACDITVADFYENEMERSGDTVFYTCTDITEDSAESLETVFGKGFESMGAVVTLEGADYYVEKIGEQILNSLLSCHFAVLLDGEIYKVTMHIDTAYDYEAEPDILIPDNAADFKEVSYDEIIK